ncbi:MAG: hypothetical protein R6U96_16065 [Promethearchaeia archaeon]
MKYNVTLDNEGNFSIEVKYDLSLLDPSTDPPDQDTSEFSLNYGFNNETKYISNCEIEGINETFSFIYASRNISLSDSEKFRVDGLAFLKIPPGYNTSLIYSELSSINMFGTEYTAMTFIGNVSNIYGYDT